MGTSLSVFDSALAMAILPLLSAFGFVACPRMGLITCEAGLAGWPCGLGLAPTEGVWTLTAVTLSVGGPSGFLLEALEYAGIPAFHEKIF